MVLLGGMLLAGCGTTSPSMTNSAPVFPDPGSAWVSGGTRVSAQDLRQVMPGITENQVYLLIREPHFNEGTYGVRAWNYIFKLRTDRPGEYVTCQFQVQFDAQRLVEATYWKDQACAQYATLGATGALVPVDAP